MHSRLRVNGQRGTRKAWFDDEDAGLFTVLHVLSQGERIAVVRIGTA